MPVKYRTETNKQAAYLFGPVIYEHEYKRVGAGNVYYVSILQTEYTVSHVQIHTVTLVTACGDITAPEKRTLHIPLH